MHRDIEIAPERNAEYDVVISGYGPSGLVAASLLAGRGHRVCVFERWPGLYGQPRMATIDGESARIVQAACDIDAALKNSLPRRRYILANGEGKVLVDMPWDREHICGFPLRISLHQPDMEDALDLTARSHGAEINQGWEVAELAQDAEFADVTARERRMDESGHVTWGRERTVRAKYVIGADGARSAVRELLGIAREAWPVRNAWLSFDALRKRTLPNILGLSPDAQVAVIFCAPDGRAHSVIPLGREHIRFNLEANPDGDHADKLNRDFAYRFLNEFYRLTEDDVDVYRSALYPFEGKLAHAWRVGRVFLAGDAAHLMTPFLGQGGCSALRDAINLSWKLDLVLRGVADEALLDSYEVERKPHVRVYVEASDRLTAAAFVADAEAAAERDRKYLTGAAVPAPADPIIETGIIDRGGALAGQLAPQGRVRRHDAEGRLDDLFGWGFQLLGRGFDPAQELSATQLSALKRIHCSIAGLSTVPSRERTTDLNGTYEHFFDAHGVEAILVRPDFTIFGTARSRSEIRSLVDRLMNSLGVRDA